MHVSIARFHVAESAAPYTVSILSAGVKSLDSSRRSPLQSSYFSGSQQQPLFLTTFDMPLEAPPTPGLRPFYGHPWPWSACPQSQGSGPSTDCNSPQHGDSGPGAAGRSPGAAVPRATARAPQSWKGAL